MAAKCLLFIDIEEPAAMEDKLTKPQTVISMQRPSNSFHNLGAHAQETKWKPENVDTKMLSKPLVIIRLF